MFEFDNRHAQAKPKAPQSLKPTAHQPAHKISEEEILQKSQPKNADFLFGNSKPIPSKKPTEQPNLLFDNSDNEEENLISVSTKKKSEENWLFDGKLNRFKNYYNIDSVPTKFDDEEDDFGDSKPQNSSHFLFDDYFGISDNDPGKPNKSLLSNLSQLYSQGGYVKNENENDVLQPKVPEVLTQKQSMLSSSLIYI